MGSGPKTARDLSTRRIVPGPGAYYFKNMTHTGISFANAKRLEVKKDFVPGPGTYRVPVKFADVPKYLIPKQDENFKYV